MCSSSFLVCKHSYESLFCLCGCCRPVNVPVEFRCLFPWLGFLRLLFFCGFAFVSTFCKIGKNPLGKTHNPDTDSASFVFHGGRGGHSAIIEIQKQRQRHGVRSYEKSKNTVGFVFCFWVFE